MVHQRDGFSSIPRDKNYKRGVSHVGVQIKPI